MTQSETHRWWTKKRENWMGWNTDRNESLEHLSTSPQHGNRTHKRQWKRAKNYEENTQHSWHQRRLKWIENGKSNNVFKSEHRNNKHTKQNNKKAIEQYEQSIATHHHKQNSSRSSQTAREKRSGHRKLKTIVFARSDINETAKCKCHRSGSYGWKTQRQECERRQKHTTLKPAIQKHTQQDKTKQRGRTTKTTMYSQTHPITTETANALEQHTRSLTAHRNSKPAKHKTATQQQQ